MNERNRYIKNILNRIESNRHTSNPLILGDIQVGETLDLILYQTQDLQDHFEDHFGRGMHTIELFHLMNQMAVYN
jgi:hypothetical protein